MTARAGTPDAQPPASLGVLLRLAVVLGLLAGILEAALRGVQRLRLQLSWVSADVVWMAPLVDALALTGLVVVLWALGAVVPAARSARSFLLVAVFALGAALLLSYGPLHPAGALLLAAGVAMQLSWLVASRLSRVDRVSRRALPWLIGATVVLGLAVRPGRDVVSALAVRNLPPPAAGAPNVLLLVLDTLRGSSLGVAGYGRPTSPNLDRFARRGTYFERAVATSAWTLPSHATMFTGRYPFELNADWRVALDSTHPTLAEALSQHGYVTAGFVANLLYATSETGLARGFSSYEDYRVSRGNLLKTSLVARQIGMAVGIRTQRLQMTERRLASEVNAVFLDWLSRQSGRPYFAFLNYMDTHSPYRPPAEFAERFGAVGPAPDVERRRSWTPREIEREKNAYDASIAMVDHYVGELLNELERRGSLANTVVVVTSDHGEMLGEHQLYDHGNSLYWPVLHVPLLIVFPPAVRAGHRVADPVTLRDLPATILDLAGARATAWPGESLAPRWRDDGQAAGRSSPVLSEISRTFNMNPVLPASKGDMKSLVVGSMHYIRNGDGSEELYELDRDPGEMRNLADGGAALLAPFRSALEEALAGRMDRVATSEH